MPAVQIKIAGVDLTSAVLFSTARFESAVNGAPGPARLRLRDPDRSLTVLPGASLELLIDGDPAWTGFVTAPRRSYVFPAINIDAFGETRFLDIEGTDLNVLFTRRIAFNQSTPEDVMAPLYAAHTADTTAISDLVSDWLDLSGDSLDTSSLVDNVGDINEDQKARAWSGSDQWGQAMASIASLPAAIYYLNPSRKLVYCDTDTPTAPFGLSDVPDGTTKRRYREMEILLDGSNLANDVMCWGIGYGSTTPVFKRDIDATSVSAHGVWQLGQTTFGIYKQATIDRVADSILNGSPEHHRGSKDDRPAVTLTTFETGLLPAQKVSFESQVFGWDDVIPIRKMEITFLAPDTPKYVLTLSHEIDTPWSFFDPWRWKLPPLPGLPGFTVPPLILPVTEGGCVGCGVTDAFGRTVSEVVHSSTSGHTEADIGASDAGPIYSNVTFGGVGWTLSNGGVGLSVDGVALVARTFATAAGLRPGSTSGFLRVTSPMTHGAGTEKTFQFTMSDLPGSTGGAPATILRVGFEFGNLGASIVPTIWINSQGSGSYNSSYIGFNANNTTNSTAIPNGYWQPDIVYTVTYLDDGTDTTITITDGVTAYSKTLTNHSLDLIENPALSVTRDTTGAWSVDETVSVAIGNWSIPEITRCIYPFDDFGRLVPGSWSTASSGLAYDTTAQTNVDIDVDSNGGVFAMNASAGTAQVSQEVVAPTGSWWNNEAFVFRALINTSEIAATGTYRLLFFEDTFATYRVLDLLFSANEIDLATAADSDSVVYSAWSDFTQMYVEITVDASNVEARVWGVDTARPSTATITVPNTDTTAVPKLRLEVDSDFAATDDFTVRTFRLDMDWAGKPCYIDPNCTNPTVTVFDDFERSTSGTWGTPTYGISAYSQDGTVTSLGVAGGVGYADLTNVKSLSESWQNLGDTSLPWSHGFTMQIDFDYFGSISGGHYVEFFVEVAENTTDETIQLGLYLTTIGGDDNLLFVGSTSGGSADYITGSTPASLDVAHVKWNFTPNGLNQAKVWFNSDPEPSSYQAFFVGTNTASGDKRIILKADSDTSVRVHFDEWVFLDCAVLPSSGTPAGPVFGPFCEIATRIDATHYQLGRQVLAGTTIVNVGTPGVLYLPGIGRDYTVNDDTGVITFADTVADGTRVYVCYTANGQFT